jgi:hypothetical protein
MTSTRPTPIATSPSSSPTNADSAKGLHSSFASAVPFQVTVHQCTAALDRLAEAIAASGPVSIVIAVPGARGLTTPAEAMAAHLGARLHQTEPPAGHTVGSACLPQPPSVLDGRVLVFAERSRGVALSRAADRLRPRLATGALLETVALVLQSRHGPPPNWWAWRITNARVLLPWDTVEPGTRGRAVQDLEEVHSS